MPHQQIITTAKVTLHCLIGCSIGELLGLLIGVSLQLAPYATMILATILAFISGMWLAVVSIRRSHNMSYKLAIKTVWFGEVISIAVMELAMNGADFYVGGVNAASIYEYIFWLGFLVAIPAGYIAAFPINYILISKSLKKCH